MSGQLPPGFQPFDPMAEIERLVGKLSDERDEARTALLNVQADNEALRSLNEELASALRAAIAIIEQDRTTLYRCGVDSHGNLDAETAAGLDEYDAVLVPARSALEKVPAPAAAEEIRP